MLDHMEALSGWEIRGDLACLLCTRAVARVQGPRARPFKATSVRVPAAEHVDTVRKMRCPHCDGRLWLQDTEEIYVDRRPLSAEDLRPRRGRPPKVARAS